MNHPPFQIGVTADLPGTIALIRRATNIRTVVGVLQEYIAQVTQPYAMQLMWQADGVTQSLFSDQPTLRLPSQSELMLLLAGQTAHGGNTAYLPILVLGELRGWMALQGGHIDTRTYEAVQHAGMALALLERQASQVTASRELSMMNKIGQMLSTTLHLEQLLPNLAVVVREFIIAQDFYIALIDESGNQLSFAYLSTDQGMPTSSQPWPIDTGLTGQIIRSNAPIVTDDYLAECARRGIQPQVPANMVYSQAWMGVPLCHHDRVLGVMVAGISDRSAQYSETDVHLMSSVAAQAAAAVANAQLYKQVQQQASQLALINRIGRTISATLDPQQVPVLIMQELKAALDVEDGSVLIEDQQTNELVVRYTMEPTKGLRLPHGVGLPGEALRFQMVRIANEMQNDSRGYEPFDAISTVPTRSIMCAPLSGRYGLRGVLQLRNKRTGPFTQMDSELIQAVAEQAAVALENAEQYSYTDTALTIHIADLEQRNRQLTNIVTLSNNLRSTNDVHRVGEHIVTAVQQMTGSPRICIGLVEPDRQAVRAVAVFGLDPQYTNAPREYWTPISAAQQMIQDAQQISTLTYKVGRHRLAPDFANCILLSLLDTNGLLVGMIAFDTEGDEVSLSNALLHELEIVANQAASAVVNARLANDQSQTVDRLTALNALSLAVTTTLLSTDEIMQMTVAGAIGTTNGFAGGWSVLGRDNTMRQKVLYLPHDCEIEVLPFLDNITADYIQLDETHVPASLVGKGVRNLFIVPVRGAKLTLGSLWIAYSDGAISATEREMVVLYAKMAGAVLENLRLFDEVSAAHDRLASILASTAEGMLLATAQGKIAAANTALRQLLGLSDAPLEDVPVTALHQLLQASDDQERVQPIAESILAVARGATLERTGELSMTMPSPRDLAWSVLPVRGSANQSSAALLVLRDVTRERQAEKLRQDLANMIVHDLRAPLTNMIVSNDLLLKQISGPLTASQQRILEIAGNSSQQMLDLVNALLDIRRLEQRQLEIQRQPVEIFEIVEAVFERLERVADDRRVHLVNTTAPLPPISADVDLVRRVVQNLVDNSTKFSPRDSTVTVSGLVADHADLPTQHADGRWLIMSIADQGKGVPEAYRTVIFELFGQAPTGRGQGTGLGLAFCKLAIAAHGGMIWVEDGPAGGAVFRFSLPLA